MLAFAVTLQSTNNHATSWGSENDGFELQVEVLPSYQGLHAVQQA
jgi:hypothetical protein